VSQAFRSVMIRPMNGPLVSSIVVGLSALVVVPAMAYLAIAHASPAVAAIIVVLAVVAGVIAVITVGALRRGQM
jgi:hypothetical protein